MRLVSTVLAIVLTFSLAACGSDSGRSSSDDAPAGPQRVASLGLGDVDTLLALGVVPVLVAPWAQDAKEPVGEWSKPLLQGKNPQMLLGTGTNLDTKAIETLAAAKPDVIVAVNSGFDDATFTRLEAIAPVVRRPAQFAAWGVPWQDQVRAIAGGIGGVSSNTSFVESTSGVAEGARTGLANVVTGLVFLLAMFFTPLTSIVPTEVAAAALVIVGAMMMAQIKNIDLTDFRVLMPVFLTITVMPMTYSIANGIGAGFVSWVLLHAFSGRAKTISPLLWIVAAGFVIFFARGPIEMALGG